MWLPTSEARSEAKSMILGLASTSMGSSCSISSGRAEPRGVVVDGDGGLGDRGGELRGVGAGGEEEAGALDGDQ